MTPKQDGVLREVALGNVRSPEEPLVAHTKIQDIAAFYRHKEHGLLSCSTSRSPKSNSKRGLTKVSYPPYDAVKSGETYTCHSLTMGAVLLSGTERNGFDLGEVASLDAYIQERYQPRFERPMFTASCINNRYAQPRGDVIFYTMKDNPTWSLNVDELKRELALMPKLGMEYYQLFPGVFDWGKDDPSPETVKEVMDYARSLGVRVGDYSATNRLFVSHYNEYRNHLDRPDWLMKGKEEKLSSGQFCFGAPRIRSALH